jgi:HEAT repeat protein
MEQKIDYLEKELGELKQPSPKQIAEFFNLLIKAIKAKLVYPSSSKLPEQFKENLSQKASSVLEEIGDLSFKISSNSILYEDTPVYESSSRTENFAHIFFRDGVVGLHFHQGIDDDEIGRFINLLAKMMRTIYIDDDLVTLLWEENFKHISYDLIDEDFEIETFEYSTNAFKTDINPSNDDIQSVLLNESQITFDEDDLSIDQQKEGLSLRGNAYARMPKETHDFLNRISEFTQDEKERIADLLASDASFDHTQYLLTIIFEILGMEKELPGYTEVLGFIGKVRDSFIRSCNFNSASSLLSRMHELLDVLKNLKSSRVEKIEEFFLDCASRQKIELLTQSINSQKDIDAEGLVDYLKQLPWAAIDPLLSSLGELEQYQARRALCKVLAEIGQDRIDLVAKGLDDERWFVVRNIVKVLGEMKNPRIIHYLKKTIRHPDYRVRKETLEAAAKINSNESIDFMILALSDPDAKIQVNSLRYLVEKKYTRAFLAVENIIKNKKFKERPPEQLREFLEAYAILGQAKAFNHLKSLATKWLFFPSGNDMRLKIYAVNALAKTNTIEAIQLLNKLASGKDKKLAYTAMRAIQIRKRDNV